MSTPKMSQLLSHSFFGNHLKITTSLIQETISNKIARLEEKAQGAESNHPTESNQVAVKKLADCNNKMQDILNSCLQPSNPLNVFGNN